MGLQHTKTRPTGKPSGANLDRETSAAKMPPKCTGHKNSYIHLYMKIDITLEEALGRATPGLRRKMEYSVELLRKAERLALAYDRRGYYLAFSGGKDSQCLYHIAQLAGVSFEGHMSLTSVDPPEVIRFVRRYYPEVELIKPKASIYQLAVEKQILPTMRVRWCCAEYKEIAGAGKVTLIGIRKSESARRKKRNEVEISSRKYSGTLEGLDDYRAKQLAKRRRKTTPHSTGEVNITNATEEQTVGCIHGKESLLINPIIHWTERDVWKFLTEVVRVPHCELYDQGFRRIGCIGCPMSNPRQKAVENVRWPHVRRNWIKAIMAIRNRGVLQGTATRKTSGGQSSDNDTAARLSGGTFKEGYIWWNIPKGMQPLPHRGRRLRLDYAPRPETLDGGGRKKRQNRGLWAGFRVARRLTA